MALLAGLEHLRALFERTGIDWRLEPAGTKLSGQDLLAGLEELLSGPEEILIGSTPDAVYTVKRSGPSWEIKRETIAPTFGGELLAAPVAPARPSRRLLGQYMRAAKNPGALSEERRRLAALRSFIALLSQELAGYSSPYILECGCGQAPLSLLLGAALGAAKVIGLDRSADALAMARALAGQLGLNAEFEAVSIVNYRSEASPDLVLAVHACGQATMDALELGLRLKARHLALVPCCAPDGYGWSRIPLPSSDPVHPVLRKLADGAVFAIDCVRRLEEAGYEVAVHETYLPPWRRYEPAIIAGLKGGCIPKAPPGA